GTEKDIATRARPVELCAQQGTGRAGRHGRHGALGHWELGSSHTSGRCGDRLGGSVLAGEGLGSGLQSCQGERACGPQPEAVELACARAEGLPFLGPGLGCVLARGKGASMIGEEIRWMVFQSVKPGGSSKDDGLRYLQRMK